MVFSCFLWLGPFSPSLCCLCTISYHHISSLLCIKRESCGRERRERLLLLVLFHPLSFSSVLLSSVAENDYYYVLFDGMPDWCAQWMRRKDMGNFWEVADVFDRQVVFSIRQQLEELSTLVHAQAKEENGQVKEEISLEQSFTCFSITVRERIGALEQQVKAMGKFVTHMQWFLCTHSLYLRTGSSAVVGCHQCQWRPRRAQG